MEAFSSWRHCSACFPFGRRCSPTAVIKDRNLRKRLQKFCRISILKSSNVPIRSADLWSCPNAGSSSAPLRGSIAAEGSPRIGRISTERRSRSCASPQSASCSENSAIQREVSGRTLRNRLPAASIQRELAEAGFLLSYGADIPDLYRRAAVFVDKIFKGAKPADLPAEQPTKFELVINLKTANALGAEVRTVRLRGAVEVIE